MDLKKTTFVMLVIIGLVTIFHLLLILKIIPYDITWGGRLTNDSEMYMFEIISIFINLFLGLTLLIKGNYVRQLLPKKIVNIILWVFVVIFALNTVGNIFAKTNFEKYFSILTLLSAIIIWRILKHNDPKV